MVSLNAIVALVMCLSSLQPALSLSSEGQAAADGSAPKRPTADALLKDLVGKLEAEGLSLSDLPAEDQAMNALFSEVGYSSALDQAKLRKAVKESLAASQPAPEAQAMPVPPRGASRPPPRPDRPHDRIPKPTPQQKSKPIKLPPKPKFKPEGDVKQAVYVCGLGDGSRPYVAGEGREESYEDLGIRTHSDGVVAYTSGALSVFRYHGFWSIGDLHPFPPVALYTCGKGCADKDLKEPPLGIPFRAVDSSALMQHPTPESGPHLSITPCPHTRRDANMASRSDL